MKIARTKILDIIKQTQNSYLVTFKKKDGTIRVMRAKQNVEYNLKGGVNRVVKPDNNYISTFNVDTFQYRTINLATVIDLTVDDIHYDVV